MIRGTTPTLEFVLPIDTGQLAEAFVTLAQRGAMAIAGANPIIPVNEEIG